MSGKGFQGPSDHLILTTNTKVVVTSIAALTALIASYLTYKYFNKKNKINYSSSSSD